MPILGFDLDQIASLISLLDGTDIEELVIQETDDRSIRIRARTVQAAPAATRRPPRSIAAQAERQPERALPRPGNLTPLVSPMVGVFYRSEKPGGTPFVFVGDHIAVDQTVGMLEAMKVFSEFKADRAGIVAEVLVEDGQLVEEGATLMLLIPD